MTTDAITRALEYNIPFAAYLLPGQGLTDLNILIDIPGRASTSSSSFFINRWNTHSADNITIHSTISPYEFMQVPPSELQLPSGNITLPNSISTSRALYNSQVKAIVEELQHEDENCKTVLSRVICGHLPLQSNSNDYTIARRWTTIAIDYFLKHPDTFRYIYYTPATGAWLGASPELLLDIDKNSHRGATMALAGTRDATEAGNWDHKNISEQQAVVLFLMNTLSDMGLKTSLSTVRDLTFGDISHRCNHISFDTYGCDIETLLDTLSPTPALAGYPRKKALDRIQRLEKHSRDCYGGYVGYNDSTRLRAYVNLRCMQFARDRYCLYAGGGITRHSQPDTEWQETVKKISSLRSLVELS